MTSKETTHRLNTDKLYADIVARQQQRKITRVIIAAEIGVNESTIKKIGDGQAPTAHVLCSILAWLDAYLDDYVIELCPAARPMS